VVIQETAVPPVPTFDSQLISRGEVIYQQFCASCHGENLEGQADWRSPLPDGSLRAPPHDATGHTWHHPDDLLFEIITDGSDPALGGTMQGFGDVIDEPDRIAVLEFIKSSWGQEEREFQWWITAR
jgi:mono/diheme cytochrome c family protein